MAALAWAQVASLAEVDALHAGEWVAAGGRKEQWAAVGRTESTCVADVKGRHVAEIGVPSGTCRTDERFPDWGTMEHPDGSDGTEPDDWAVRSLDESERRLRAADRDAALSGWGSADSAGGGAVLVASLLSAGRWLYRAIRRKGR